MRDAENQPAMRKRPADRWDRHPAPEDCEACRLNRQAPIVAAVKAEAAAFDAAVRNPLAAMSVPADVPETPGRDALRARFEALHEAADMLDDDQSLLRDAADRIRARAGTTP